MAMKDMESFCLEKQSQSCRYHDCNKCKFLFLSSHPPKDFNWMRICTRASRVWHLASDADTDKQGQTKLIYSAHGEKELPGTRSTSTNTDKPTKHDEKTLKSNTGGRNKAQVF